MIDPADYGEANASGSEVAFFGREVVGSVRSFYVSVRNWVWRETDGGPENYRRRWCLRMYPGGLFSSFSDLVVFLHKPVRLVTHFHYRRFLKD